MAGDSWIYQGRQAHGYFGSGTSKGLQSPAGTGLLPVGNDGMPRDRGRQNKQFQDVFTILKLNKDQADILHREIHGQNCTFGD